MQLGEYFKSKKISVLDFAAELNVSKPTVYRWLDGTRYPNRERMIEIYKLTNKLVEPNDMVLQDDAPKKKTLLNFLGGK